MCMYCKCKTIRQSTTTHVVNYNNCIIIVKNVPCEEVDMGEFNAYHFKLNGEYIFPYLAL